MKNSTLKVITAASLLTLSGFCLADNDAKRSLEIDVPEGFMFTSHREMNLDISVADTDGSPLSGIIIRVQAIPADDQDQDMKPETIFIGRTNESGWLTSEVDFPHYVKKVRIVASSLGFEGQREIDLTNNEYLSVNF